MPRLTIRFEGDVGEQLGALKRRVQDRSRLFRNVGEYMLRQTINRFDAQKDPDGKAPPRLRGWTSETASSSSSRPGSPAPAGMDLMAFFNPTTAKRLPRACGDGPVSAAAAIDSTPAPPRLRGWTFPDHAAGRIDGGSPAPAGMDHDVIHGHLDHLRLPRACGDPGSCMNRAPSGRTGQPSVAGLSSGDAPPRGTKGGQRLDSDCVRPLKSPEHGVVRSNRTRRADFSRSGGSVDQGCVRRPPPCLHRARLPVTLLRCDTSRCSDVAE